MHQKRYNYRQYIIINQEASRAGQPLHTEGWGGSAMRDGGRTTRTRDHLLPTAWWPLVIIIYPGLQNPPPEVKRGKNKKAIVFRCGRQLYWGLTRPASWMPPPSQVLSSRRCGRRLQCFATRNPHRTEKSPNLQITYSRHLFSLSLLLKIFSFFFLNVFQNHRILFKTMIQQNQKGGRSRIDNSLQAQSVMKSTRRHAVFVCFFLRFFFKGFSPVQSMLYRSIYISREA